MADPKRFDSGLEQDPTFDFYSDPDQFFLFIYGKILGFQKFFIEYLNIFHPSVFFNKILFRPIANICTSPTPFSIFKPPNDKR